jgi:hypothetical protein
MRKYLKYVAAVFVALGSIAGAVFKITASAGDKVQIGPSVSIGGSQGYGGQIGIGTVKGDVNTGATDKRTIIENCATKSDGKGSTSQDSRHCPQTITIPK